MIKPRKSEEGQALEGDCRLSPGQRLLDWISAPTPGGESGFLTDFQEGSVRQQRNLTLLGGVVYLLHGLYFGLSNFDAYGWAAFLCMCYISPGLLVLSGMTFFGRFAKHGQLFIALGLAAIFVPSGVAFMLWTPARFDLYARPAILVLTMTSFVALRLLWPYALTLALAIQLSQVLTAILIGRWTGEEAMSILSSLGGADATGLFVCVQMGAAARRDYVQTQNLLHEKEKSERLLLNILPETIAARLKNGGGAVADRFEQVTVMFADLVGFTEMATRMEPEALVMLLDEVFSRFDALAEHHGVEKIKTIGDAYMVVSGLPERTSEHAPEIARMALGMLNVIQTVNASNDTKLSVRIGINTGPVVAGVIGRKRLIYDLWGDTVNMASRMESHGTPGSIQITEATAKALGGQFQLELRGSVRIKGAGELTTYWLTGARWSTPETAA